MTRRTQPTPADYDDMHHALGRPDGAHVKPYRNFYSCAATGPTADRFAALGLWDFRGTMNDGRDGVWAVSDEGCRKLMAWLAERNRKAGIKAWRVFGGGVADRIVMAKSASAARFSVYAEISDVYHFDGGFRGFLRLGVRARRA